MRVLLALVFLFSLPLAQAQDESPGWPRWRGPERDGVSRETGWDAVGSPDPLWRAEVGLGYSNVTVADGRLTTIGHDPEAGVDRVVCLDAHTGEVLWSHSFAAETMDNFHGGGSQTTPTHATAPVRHPSADCRTDRRKFSRKNPSF